MRTEKKCNKVSEQENFSGREDVDWVPQRRSWGSSKTLEALGVCTNSWRKHSKVVVRDFSPSRTLYCFII